MRPQKIAKDLRSVKRAPKTLGVEIIEFDEHDDCMDCLKDYCKLGCICDSLRTKQIPPAHCGKVECMFSCCCSKEADTRGDVKRTRVRKVEEEEEQGSRTAVIKKAGPKRRQSKRIKRSKTKEDDDDYYYYY